MEIEDNSDENIWGLLGDFLEDIMAQQFSGSMVLLILGVVLFAVYAPSVFRLLTAYVTRNTPRS